MTERIVEKRKMLQEIEDIEASNVKKSSTCLTLARKGLRILPHIKESPE